MQVLNPGGGTHCPYCAMQCAITLMEQDGKLEVAPREFPTNRGGLCRKGWTAAELLERRPATDANAPREPRRAAAPRSWDEALDRLAQGFRAAQAAGGADAVGVFGGGALTNEKAYVLGKFARVALGTRNIDYNGRFCMSSAAAAGNRAFGIDRGLPFPLRTSPKADASCSSAATPPRRMPPSCSSSRRSAARRRADRRRPAPHRDRAAAATCTCSSRPAPTSRWPTGCCTSPIGEGLIDEDYIAARTDGFDECAAACAANWPERVERVTGVP